MNDSYDYDSYDLVIAGGGAAGLSLALAVKQAAGKALSVAICDPALAENGRGDSRAYAIVRGASRFFDSFGAWTAMAPQAQPMRGMEITDSGLEELVRPLMLEFCDTPGGDEPFAEMLPNRVILAALMARLRQSDISVLTTGVEAFTLEGSRIVARTGGRRLSARLLVAADGRASKLREQAGIAYFGWKYPQTAIVGTISHTLPHEGVAVQHFLPSGPFAMLPLRGADGTGRESSIVWSEDPEVARRCLAMQPEDLLAEVDRRAAGRFGTVTALAGAEAFPLSLGIARRFAGERLALLGDAAHGMHPSAGRGDHRRGAAGARHRLGGGAGGL